MIEEIKYVCAFCKISKLSTAFHKNNNSKRGIANSCKECRSNYNKKFIENKALNPQVVPEYAKCRICKMEKLSTYFFKDLAKKQGIRSICKTCEKEQDKIYVEKNRDTLRQKRKDFANKNKEKIKIQRKQSRLKNKDKIKLVQKEWREKNKEYFKTYLKKYREDNEEVLKIKRRSYYLKNKEYINKNNQEYSKNNRASINAGIAKYYALRLKAIPPWADLNKIKEFYIKAKLLTQQTGIEHEVDHIIPLRGKKVTGLHVHTNLQVITASENASKNNKFIIE